MVAGIICSDVYTSSTCGSDATRYFFQQEDDTVHNEHKPQILDGGAKITPPTRYTLGNLVYTTQPLYLTSNVSTMVDDRRREEPKSRSEAS